MIVVADFGPANAEGGVAALVRQAPMALEAKACAHFLLEINRQARRYWVAQLVRSLKELGYNTDRSLVRAIYDLTIGHFYELEEIGEGSCRTRCKDNRHKVAWFVSVCLLVFGDPIDDGMTKSDVGKYISRTVESTANTSLEYIKYADQLVDDMNRRALEGATKSLPYSITCEASDGEFIVRIYRREDSGGPIAGQPNAR